MAVVKCPKCCKMLQWRSKQFPRRASGEQKSNQKGRDARGGDGWAGDESGGGPEGRSSYEVLKRLLSRLALAGVTVPVRVSREDFSFSWFKATASSVNDAPSEMSTSAFVGRKGARKILCCANAKTGLERRPSVAHMRRDGGRDALTLYPKMRRAGSALRREDGSRGGQSPVT